MTNRQGATLSVLSCGFALLAACSSDKRGAFVTPDGDGGASAAIRAGAGGRNAAAGSAGTGGKPGSSGAGGGGAIENGPLAPSVEITAPKPVADPNQGTVLTDAQVVVTCLATASTEAGAKKVLTSSIKIVMLDADGKQIGMDGNVHSTQTANQYAASFALTDVQNGAVSFKCSATDEGTPANLGSAAVTTFVDHGPMVTLETPEQSSAYPISPAILFQFSAIDAPLSDKDKKAGVVSVKLTVNGVSFGDVTPHAVAGMPGEYQLPIDLADPALFTPPPTGAVPVRIVATNKRGVARTSDFSFNVDNLGPVIKIVSPPTPNQFIGGKVTLSFTVVDMPAGVAAETVKVVLNGVPSTYSKDDKSWSHATDNAFAYTFDTKNFDSQILLSVNIRADDLAGNASDGASIQYYIDNVPPIIDLSPPKLQERQFVSQSKWTCSEEFFPLGDSPVDLETVPAVTRLRALLWDVGNTADGQDAFYFSDIDNANTNTIPHLYFQTDTSKPLLKNADPTKHGEVCNAIADETLPLVTLVPLAPAGVAYYSPAAQAHAGVCEAGTDAQAPLDLCGGNSDLSRVVQHELGLTTPVVAAVYVVAPDSLQCTGSQFDLTNIATKDGWVCAAVSAIDRTGNRSVSAPIRLCLDAVKYPGSPPCASSSVNPPSCVDDCVPPPHFAPGIISKPH